jgi:hypothetical protein
MNTASGHRTEKPVFTSEPKYATHPFALLTQVWQTPKGELVSFLEG